LSSGLVDVLVSPITIEAVTKAMDESLSQNDLDALFGDLQVEIKKPREVKEVKDIETLEGN